MKARRLKQAAGFLFFVHVIRPCVWRIHMQVSRA